MGPFISISDAFALKRQRPSGLVGQQDFRHVAVREKRAISQGFPQITPQN
jgi:hypothetical protein